MPETLFRTFTAEVDSEARTFSGVLVPWDEPTEVRDADGKPYREAFARGAFDLTAGQSVYCQHEYRTDPFALPVGQVTEVRDEDDGLHISGRISSTGKGNDLHALMRDGVIGALSAGFNPISDENRSGVTVRTRAELAEVSVTPRGAYPSARITEVRYEATASTTEGNHMPETVEHVEATEFRTFADDIERRITAISTPAPVPAGAMFRTAGDAILAARRGDENALQLFRTYAGSTLGDTHAQPAWIERALRIVDRGRPVTNLFGVEPLEGDTVKWPVVSSSTDGTAKQDAEGDALGYSELVTSTASATADTFGNYSEISRREQDHAPASYFTALWQLQVAGYTKATEAATRTALAAITAGSSAGNCNKIVIGAAPSAVTSAATWLGAVIDAAAAIEANSTGLTAEFLLLSSDVFKTLVGILDGDKVTTTYTSGVASAEAHEAIGRPVFGLSGTPTNGIGEANLIVPAGSINGLPIVVGSLLAANSAYVCASGALVSFESTGAPVRMDEDAILTMSHRSAAYGYFKGGVVLDSRGISKLVAS